MFAFGIRLIKLMLSFVDWAANHGCTILLHAERCANNNTKHAAFCNFWAFGVTFMAIYDNMLRVYLFKPNIRVVHIM